MVVAAASPPPRGCRPWAQLGAPWRGTAATIMRDALRAQTPAAFPEISKFARGPISKSAHKHDRTRLRIRLL